MELRPARSSERDQVLDLLALWYGDRGFFARYNHHDPGFRDDLCLVACEDGRIVATAQIFAAHRELARRARSAGRHRLGVHDGALSRPWRSDRRSCSWR